jgi:GAF domain
MASIERDHDYIGIVDASRMLGVSRTTLHMAVAHGKLVPDMRTPRGHVRFRPETIATFRDTLCEPATPPPPPASPLTALPPLMQPSMLTRVTHMLSAHSDPDQICQKALAILRETVPAVEMCYIAVRAPSEQDPWDVHVPAHEGFPATMISLYRQLGASDMLFTTIQAMRTGTMARFDDTADPHARLERGSVPIIRELEARTLVVVPFLGEQRATGAVVAMSTKPYAFSDDEVAFIAALADYLAVALVSAQALGSLRATLATGGDLTLRALRLRASGAKHALAELAAAFRAATGAYTVCTAGLSENLPGTEPFLLAITQQACDSGIERLTVFGADDPPNTGVVAAIPLAGGGFGAIAAAWRGRRSDWELHHYLLTILGAAYLLVSPPSNV